MHRDSVPFKPLLERYPMARIRTASEAAGLNPTTIDTARRRDSMSMWTGDLLAKHLGGHVDAIWTDFPIPHIPVPVPKMTDEERRLKRNARRKEALQHPRKGFKL